MVETNLQYSYGKFPYPGSLREKPYKQDIILPMKRTLSFSLLLTLLTFSLSAQHLIQGYVRDAETREPIEGATVVEDGTSNGTFTDLNGYFQLQLGSPNSTLIVSCMGYVQERVYLKGQSKLDIRLRPENLILDEVVITNAPRRPRIKKPGRKDKAGSNRNLRDLYPAPIQEKPQRYHYPKTGESLGISPEPALEEEPFNREGYENLPENDFKEALGSPVSTFSIDVDKASYANVRRYLNSGQLPPPSAVRIEELINYFPYNYPEPRGKHPFAVHTEVSDCPWNQQHLLLHVGLKGKSLNLQKAPPSNLVFLIDVSGSMNSANKLGLLKLGLEKLVQELRPKDRVAIVVYAGAAGLVLPSTPGAQKETILRSLQKLTAGGSTAGGAGIKMAYQVAQDHFLPHGNNRIILATDGDFNVGTSSDGELVKLIEEKRKSGVFLTVLGLGTGNYQDAKMEKLADHGNGNFFYIDGEREAQKVLVEEMSGTLFAIAKDVKIQIEFNPQKVQSYRLIGYENRLLAREDFNDDTKDAGELGAGHTVTALYEIIPVSLQDTMIRTSDPLRYQESMPTDAALSLELATVKLRYKLPRENESILLETVVKSRIQPLTNCSSTFQFASAVAEFGLILRQSAYKGKASLNQVKSRTKDLRTPGFREDKKEFMDLISLAQKYQQE
jgi:Ca-activated chloride channel family protein